MAGDGEGIGTLSKTINTLVDRPKETIKNQTQKGKYMKIGIISDTHHRTTLHKEAISHLLSEGAEYLLHTGDIGTKEHIKMLEDTQKPYRVVFGNNDHHLMALSGRYHIYKEPYYLQIEGIKIKMMHLPYYMTPDSDIIISGHTHQFSAQLTNKKLFLNSGEVCARNKPLSEAMILEITNSSYIVDRFYRNPKDIEWQKRRFIFDR